MGYLIYFAATIWLYGFHDETIKTDVAIVLGAGTDGILPSPVFKERLDHAIWLYQSDYVENLILTGGVSEGALRSDSAIARDYVLENGIPKQNIFIEEHSLITQQNLIYAQQIMEQNGFESVLIVSDPLHMKRAMLTASQLNMEAYSSPTTTTKYVTLKTQLPFLARETFFYIGQQLNHIFGFVEQ